MFAELVQGLMSRRQALTGFGASALAASASGSTAAQTVRGFDFTRAADHLKLFVKMSASLEEGATSYLLYSGTTFGVLPGNDVRPLYGMSGVSPVRTFRTPDGGYRFLASEASVFTDLASGSVLETWANPFLDGEVQKVWHLRNGPLNYEIHPEKPISGGGWRLLIESRYGRAGFFMPIQVEREDIVVTLDVQATRRNPLEPGVWKRESTGSGLRYSEHNTWRVSRAEAEDESRPTAHAFAAWHSFKEWRPWMLMGARPGHIYNHLVARRISSLAEAPRELVAWYAKNHPAFLEAPREWTGAYRSDWDYFKEARTPAP